ncbi:MAG: ribosome recycling factor, partial [Puniceicoccales bacterium]|nr:ribosome recycling factor [Puniceicoccales bacterium]
MEFVPMCTIRREVMPQIQEIRIIQEKMRKAVQFTGSELGTIHAGKASPAMVEGVNVEVYGASSHLRDIAAITVPDPRTISIQPWDRGTVKPI